MVEDIASMKKDFNFSSVLFSWTEFGLSPFYMPLPGIDCAEPKCEKYFRINLKKLFQHASCAFHSWVSRLTLTHESCGILKYFIMTCLKIGIVLGIPCPPPV